MDKLKKLETALEKFNSSLDVVSRDRKASIVRTDFFNKITAQIKQIRADLDALGKVLGATNDVVGNIERDLSTLDKSDKIEAAWSKSLKESEERFREMTVKLAGSIPPDNTKEILASISNIPVPVIPEYKVPKFPDIKIPKVPEFPEIPEPVKRWIFEIVRDGDGKIVDVIARADG